MLTEMLKLNPNFQSLPTHIQEVYARLAAAFQEDNHLLYQDPDTLIESTSLGNKQMWTDFLRMEPVQNYIKAQMTQLTQIAQRRAFLSLQQQAVAGNVQAVKEINELSGIMDRSDDNRVVVLHQIARPTTQEA